VQRPRVDGKPKAFHVPARLVEQVRQHMAKRDRQAKPFAGQPQTGDKLLSVNRREGFDWLDLHDHQIFDNQTHPEPDVDPNRPLDHWDRLLAEGLEFTLSKLISEQSMVERPGFPTE
jgi:hypothetical protein